MPDRHSDTLQGASPASLDPRAILIENERTKLTATDLNGLAVAVAVVGGLAPIFSVLYASTTPLIPTWIILSNALVC